MTIMKGSDEPNAIIKELLDVALDLPFAGIVSGPGHIQEFFVIWGQSWI